MGLLDRFTERARKALWTATQTARNDGVPATRDHLLLGIGQDGLANLTLTEMGCSLLSVQDEVRRRRVGRSVIAGSSERATVALRSHLEAAGLLSAAWGQSFAYIGDEHLLATYLEDWTSGSWSDLPAHIRDGLATEKLGCEVLRDAGAESDRFLSMLKQMFHGNW